MRVAPRLLARLRGALLGAALGGMLATAVACPGDGLAEKAINLGRDEARSAAWLRGEIEPLLPCRDKSSQLGCMCRPVVEVDLLLPSNAIDKPKGKGKGGKDNSAAPDSLRKLLAVKRALHGLGDVGSVQLRMEYRTSESGKLVLLKPAQVREGKKVLRMVAPAGAGRSLQGVAPVKGQPPATARYVLRVTFT